VPETPEQYVERLQSLLADRDPWTVLTSTATRLRRLVASCPLERLKRRPVPDRWSAGEILAHLADAEIVGAWRARSMLATNGVTLQPYDQNQWALTFDYANANPVESLDLFEVTRAGTLNLLRRIDVSLRENHGVHLERGRETVTDMLRLYAGHDLNHVGQIEHLLDDMAPAFEPAPPLPEFDARDIPVDIRVGTIEAVESIPTSRKLMKLTVDFGNHRRTIVAGIRKERADPSSLVGRQSLFVINLPTRIMAGVESQGMLFDLGYADGLAPCLAVPERPVPNGTRAG
jgi:tRNA-binding protein